MNNLELNNNSLSIRQNSALSPSILLDNFQPTTENAKKDLSLKATLHRYISILKDGKKQIFITTFVFMVLALLLALLTNASYVAKATIKIKVDPTQYVEYQIDANNRSYVNDEFFYNTESRLLRSRDLVKKVIQDLGIKETLLKEKKYKDIVYAITTPIKLLISSLRELLTPKTSDNGASKVQGITADDIFLKKLAILPIRNSRLVTIKYTSNDSVLAKKVVDALVKGYIQTKYVNKKAVADNATSFLNTQIKKARRSLYIAEFNLISYSKHNDIIDIESDKSITASNLLSLNKAYINAVNKRIAIQQSYDIKKGITGKSSYFSDPIIQNYRKEVNKLSFLYQGNLKNFKPMHPTMVALAARIDEINKNISIEFEKKKSNELESFKASLNVALEIEDKIKEKIASYEKKLLKYRDTNIEYSNLKREVETSQAIYSGLLKRLKEIDAVPIVDDNITVIEYPDLPHQKDSPRTKKYIALGFLLGLLISLVSVLLKEFLSPIIRSNDEIEAISKNYKVLASLPKIKQKKGIINFVNNKETLRYFQNIYTSMPLQGQFPKCLHITSAKKQEGKTAVAVNLAVSIAKLNKKVLLIDADLNDSKVHEYFDINNEYGLSDFLTGDDKKILNTVMKDRLFVITAGQSKQNPMTILSNPKFIKFLEVSANMFDHIIIDSAPILCCSESRLIANQSSATLLVVREKKVYKKEIEDTLSLLNRAGATLVGFVNNMSTSKV